MTIKELEKLEKKGVIRRWHTSWKQGYVHRTGKGYVEPYEGNFGKGYTLHTPSWETSRYHYVTYFIENKKEK